jgi:putative peptidoglycan lipid II flippase
MALATPFYVVGGMLSYLETAFGRYGAIAWRPLLLNVGSIAGAALAVLIGADLWLAVGLVVSHVGFFIWTVIEIRRLDQLVPSLNRSFAEVWGVTWQFLKNSFPLLCLPLIAQTNVLVERIVSSWFGTEVIPSVDYARFISDTVVNLVAVPLGIFTMSVHGGADKEQSSSHIRLIAALLIVTSFPIAGIIITNTESIVRLLFARGKFDHDAVAVTTEILRWMGGSLGTTVSSYYLVKALNAQLRNVEALISTALAALANMFINLMLWKSLGPQCIGMGVAAFSLVLFCVCVWCLGLLTQILRFLIWVALGLAVQLTICGIEAKRLSFPIDLLASVATTACLWLAIILLVAPIRVVVAPFLEKLPKPVVKLLLRAGCVR